MATSSTPLPRPEGRISGLEADTRHGACVRVHVGGRPYCTVAAAVVRAEGLAVGREIDDALHARLARAADAEGAYRTALRALERRSYARADLGRRLVRKGHPREAAAAAIERLAGLGLLDDAAFAGTYVQTRAGRGRGPVRLQRDLASMGVDRAVVDGAIAAHWPDGTEDAGVPLALATRRLAQLGDLPRPVKRRRLLAFLARRGYSGYTVNAVVSRVLSAGS